MGFIDRPVVGGVFMRMLYEKPVWQKYAQRDKPKASGWAPMPKLPGFEVVVPTADKEPALWRYTTSRTTANWFAKNFDGSSWSEGKGGFGKTQNASAVVNTPWTTDDIWLRREVELHVKTPADLLGWLHHDDDAEVYINGILVIHADGATPTYEDFQLKRRAVAAIRPGKNVIVIHCKNTGGEQYIDFGFVRAKVSQ